MPGEGGIHLISSHADRGEQLCDFRGRDAIHEVVGKRGDNLSLGQEADGFFARFLS